MAIERDHFQSNGNEVEWYREFNLASIYVEAGFFIGYSRGLTNPA